VQRASIQGDAGPRDRLWSEQARGTNDRRKREVLLSGGVRESAALEHFRLMFDPFGSLLRKMALVSSVLLTGCGGAAPAPTSVVLITLDTMRSDALRMYDPEGCASTPNLERLAERGIVFTAASTVAPITLPAHASMLTGLYPPRHGIRDNAFAALPDSALTLAEAARAAGVQTAAFVASAVLRGEFGLAQGFEVFDAPALPDRAEAHHTAERSGSEVIDGARAWLAQRDPRRPFLLWVHLFEPHAPYEPPAEFLLAHADDAYLGEVAYVDRILAPLLDELEALEEPVTLLAVGDHGEGLGDHGELTHSFFLFESTISVPMILVRGDGQRAGERSEAVVSVVDVAPTLADSLGLRLGSGIDGESLWHRDPAPQRGVYFESYAGHLSFGWGPLSGWRRSSRKYVHGPTPELYDLALDPGESRNLAPEAGDLRPYLEGIEAVASGSVLDRREGDAVDVRFLEEIRSLGYVSTGPTHRPLPHPLDDGAGPSPHERSAELHEIQIATTHYQEGRFAEALRIFDRLLKENSGNPRCLYMRANCLLSLDRPVEAIEPLQAALQFQSGTTTDHYNLAVALRKAGRVDEAIESFERALSLVDERPPWFPAFMQILQSAGRADRAREWRARFKRGAGPGRR